MNTVRLVVAGIVAVALAGCGAEEIASPGSGGNITINNPPPSGGGGGGSEPPADLATPAGACPAIANIESVGGVLTGGLIDKGTITGPTGTYRVCELPPVFRKDTTLARVPGVLYSINGRVDVGYDLGPVQGGALPPHVPPSAIPPGSTTPPAVTLTVQPGVIFFAEPGPSWLAVNRGNKIAAAGTAERPIIFTSRDDVAGFNNDATQGQWGGIVLLGRAPVTDCATGATPGTVDCYRQTEGSVTEAWFGGATPDDNSGVLQYVQIRYSGYVLSGNSELQSLTLEGVGSGTTVSHIHSHNSSDDGFEIFGGRVKLRHFVITGADDDSVDVDTGYKGTIQYVIAVQKTSSPADSVIELDTNGTTPTTNERQTPRTHMKLANFTLIHHGTAPTGNDAAVRLRGAADVALVNGIITSTTKPGLRVDNTPAATCGSPPVACGWDIMGAADAANDEAGPPVFRSVVVQGAGGVGIRSGSAAGLADLINTPGHNNNLAFLPSLGNVFVNGAAEDLVVATDPQTIDPEFDATDYIGAVRDASDTWYAGWTCNSATANFGSTSGSCTSLPSLED